jgi:hypothetical protein
MATVLEQLACERPSENIVYATILAPIRAFFGFSAHQSMLLYAWALVLTIYLILFFLVPISFLNSSNGFKSGFVVLVSTVVIFSIVVMTYVLWNRKTACASKKEKLEYYVVGRRPQPPTYLESAIQRVTARQENKYREPEQWNPIQE